MCYVINRDLNPYFRVGIQKGMSDDEELPLHDMASLVFSMAYPFLLLYLVQFSISCKFSYSEGGM